MSTAEGMSRRAMLAGAAAATQAVAVARGVAAAPGYLAAVVAELRKAWPKNRTVNVVCHGHSVPAGYFRTPIVRTFDAYPHLLHRALQESYPYAVINVMVTAIGGEHSESGAQRFESDVLAKQPDVVLIDYGLNDRGIGLERAATAWKRMLSLAAQRSVPVLMLTPTADFQTDFANAELPIVQHARQIRELAAQQGVGLVDSFAAFEGHVKSGGRVVELLSQSNHPNRKGHELVVERILPYFWSPESLTVR